MTEAEKENFEIKDANDIITGGLLISLLIESPIRYPAMCIDRPFARISKWFHFKM